MTILRQLLTIWQPFLWLLSDMAGHLKRRRRGSCAARFFVFTLHFLQKMTKRGQDIFIFLKSAKNFAYFEPKMTILRQKLTIWQPFLWVLSDMARHLKRRLRGSCAARFYIFSLHFLQKIPNKGQCIFRYLKSAENSAYFETKFVFLRQKLTILQPFLSDMASTKKEAEEQLRGPVFHLPTAFS